MKNMNEYIISADVSFEVELDPDENLKNRAKKLADQYFNRNLDYNYLTSRKKDTNIYTPKSKFDVKFTVKDSVTAISEDEAVSMFKKMVSKDFYNIIEDSITIENVEPGVDVI